MVNQALRQAREKKGWSQNDVAEQIGTNRFTVTRWERGMATPSPYFRQRLCTLFAMTPGELGLLKEKPHGSDLPSTYWHVPFYRNPFFTGREATLRSLSTHLNLHRRKQGVSLVALCGLGGVGKTQLALEYAYRHRRNYQAVLWVQADSHTTLLADFGNLMHVLQLEGKDKQNQPLAIKAVQCWLAEQRSWLLIFDNVEDIEAIRSLIPAIGRGHVLLTTRHHATNTLANHIEVDALTPEEGTLFLLRRAKIIPATTPYTALSLPDLQAAQSLSHLMDNLPLALDQAGAYIEETGCNIAGYLRRYQNDQLQLLQRRGSSVDHPSSVAATWLISFEKLKQINPTAVTLLQLCALLHPDAIPEEIFIAELPPLLQPIAADLFHLDTLIDVLYTFSLIRRHPETGTLSLHRLVQTVLTATMNEQTQQQQAEYLVRAVNAIFPDCQSSNWPLCHRYLPQALACTKLIQQWHLVLPAAARLLAQTGAYLQVRASYDQVTQLYQDALAIHRQLGSIAQPEGARCLFALATLYDVQGRMQEAETLYQDVLAIQTQALAPDHPEIAQTLNTLALFYYKQDKCAQAEPLYLQALHFFQQTGGAAHPDVARCLSNLGTLYREQGHYRQAETLQQQALRLREQVFGPDHLEVAASYRSLAMLAHEQGDFHRAGTLYQQALSILQATLGPDHPEVALILRGLGLLSYGQRNYPQAEVYYRRVLAIRQHTLRPGHPALGDVFTLLAELCVAQQRWSEAKEYFHLALEIWEPLVKPDSPDLAHCFHGLAEVAVAQGEYGEAETFAQGGLSIMKHTFGEGHQYVAQSLHVLAGLRRTQARYEHAETLYQQALSILEHHFGSQHPRIALSLHGLAITYEKQALYSQALPLYQRILTIYAQFLPPEHPDVIHAQQQSACLQLEVSQQAAAEI